jgi:hypothetical protein
MSASWHIVTPELPPDCGGVGDYTAQIAEALARNGDHVSVYCPPPLVRWNPLEDLEVVTLGDRFGLRAMRELSARIDRDRNSRLLVQYVPAVFGRRGTNVAFCRWLLSRRRAGCDVAVMFHEPYLYLRWRPDHIVTAFTQRAMAAILLDAANHLYLSTDTWRRYLARLRPGAVQDAVTLPIPSAIPRVEALHAVNATRNASIGNAKYLVGHFGSYGSHIAPILERAAALCTGSGSDRFVKRFGIEHPSLSHRLSAVGRASAHDISVQLQACDVLLQPYPDGVTTRRTSVMAGLANGRAVVTSDGKLTEDVWRTAHCVALTPAHDVAALAQAIRVLLDDAPGRAALQSRAAATYASCFALQHTIDALRAERLQMSAV